MAYPGRNQIYEAAIKRMVIEALEKQEQEFRNQYGEKPDKELLDYLKECASALGHSPWPREIIGGKLMLERFGTWINALERADLSAPSTPDQVRSFARIQEVTEQQIRLYRQKRGEKKVRVQRRRAKQARKKGIPDQEQDPMERSEQS